MKQILVPLMVFGMLCGCSPKKVHTGRPSTPATENAETLHILCYNIHHANPPGRPGIIDLEAIAKVIRQQSPDIVALQEVDVNTHRSGKTVNQAREIAHLSGLAHYYFAKAIDYDGGEYGVAILSRYPLRATRNSPLPTAEGTQGEPRTLASAEVTLTSGRTIVFACTHLDAQRPDTNRLLQISRISELMNGVKLPVVIAGDFNAHPSSRIISKLDENFTRSCVADCGFTIPADKPRNTIDYVAFKPAGRFTVVAHKVIDEKYASDHLPVDVILRLP